MKMTLGLAKSTNV